MTTRVNSTAIALAFSIVSGLGYLLCAIFVFTAPDTAMIFFNTLFHGIDITKIASTEVDLANVVLGFVEIIVLSFAGGWLFGGLYNYLSKEVK